MSYFTHTGIAKALSGGDIDDSSALKAIATTTSEESDDVDNENSTCITFIIKWFESLKFLNTSDLYEYHVNMYNYTKWTTDFLTMTTYLTQIYMQAIASV